MAKRTFTDGELAALELARRSVNKHLKRNGGGYVGAINESLRSKGTADLVKEVMPLIGEPTT